MLSLYDLLKARKTGIAPDLWTALAAKNLKAADVKETTGELPLIIKTNGTPLLDYRIYGNMDQNGTPMPDLPILPMECGERTGNWFSTTWEQGAIDTNGILVHDSAMMRTKDFIEIIPNVIYSMSRNKATGFINVRGYDSNYSFVGTGSSIITIISGDSASNPMGANTSFCSFKIKNTNIKYLKFNDRTNDLSSKYMFVEGEYAHQTMPEFEPYGYKLPITSAGQTSNIYLGEVPTTRKIKKLVLTGKESFTKNNTQSTNYLYYANRATIFSGSIDRTPVLCNELPVINSAPQKEMGINTVNSFSVVYFNFGADVMNAQPSGNTIAGLKEYLAAQYAAGTPVTVWYVLANPETTVVNEPLRKIGNYADTVSMEQAQVQIPTNRGLTTIDVATTLKPSQAYIKYRG